MSILRVRDKDGNIQEILTIRGEQGEQGPKGDAPVRGVDYYTETDKQEIIEDILENVNIGITEDNFYDLLSEQANDPDSILSSTYASIDRVNNLDDLIVHSYVNWDDVDVDGGVASHEALEDLKYKTETNHWGYLPTEEFSRMLQEEIENEDSDLNAKYATNSQVEETLEDYATNDRLTEVYDELSVSYVDWDTFEQTIYGEESDIVNNEELEQILSDYPTFTDTEWFITTPYEEGGMSEAVILTVLDSEDFNASVSNHFYGELEAIAAHEPDSDERRLFAEAVLAVLPIYNGEYSVEVV